MPLWQDLHGELKVGFGSEILDTPLAQSFLSDGRNCENSPAIGCFMHEMRAFDACVTFMSQALRF